MAKLRMLAGHEVVADIELNDDYMSFGRGEDTNICIQHSSLSRLHGMLVRDGDDYQIHDFASTNGTYVNGQRIMAAKLKHGDRVRIGLVEFRYESAPQPAVAEDLASAAKGHSATPAVDSGEKTTFVPLPVGPTPPAAAQQVHTTPTGQPQAAPNTSREPSLTPPASPLPASDRPLGVRPKPAGGDRPLKIRLKEPPAK